MWLFDTEKCSILFTQKVGGLQHCGSVCSDGSGTGMVQIVVSEAFFH